jgi:hypothetical protein
MIIKGNKGFDDSISTATLFAVIVVCAFIACIVINLI